MAAICVPSSVGAEWAVLRFVLAMVVTGVDTGFSRYSGSVLMPYESSPDIYLTKTDFV